MQNLSTDSICTGFQIIVRHYIRASQKSRTRKSWNCSNTTSTEMTNMEHNGKGYLPRLCSVSHIGWSTKLPAGESLTATRRFHHQTVAHMTIKPRQLSITWGWYGHKLLLNTRARNLTRSFGRESLRWGETNSQTQSWFEILSAHFIYRRSIAGCQAKNNGGIW